jgi:ATP-dependent protease ClpP protease subunit
MNKNEFVINGTINERTFGDAVNFASEVVNLGLKNIIVFINSTGGSVNNGLTIYDLFKSLPCNITTVALGNCFSIATVIFSLGEKRFIGKNTKFLIHSCSYRAVENSEANAYELKNIINSMEDDNSTIINCYLSAKNFIMPKKHLEEIFASGKDVRYTLQELLLYGFATAPLEDLKEVFNVKN